VSLAKSSYIPVAAKSEYRFLWTHCSDSARTSDHLPSISPSAPKEGGQGTKDGSSTGLHSNAAAKTSLGVPDVGSERSHDRSNGNKIERGTTLLGEAVRSQITRFLESLVLGTICARTVHTSGKVARPTRAEPPPSPSSARFPGVACMDVSWLGDRNKDLILGVPTLRYTWCIGYNLGKRSRV
jgi:hypothetical protein